MGEYKIHGGVGSSANISVETQIVLTLQEQSSCSYFSALRSCQECHESSLRTTKYVKIQRGQKKLCAFTVKYKLHTLLDLWENNPQG